jgi:hypothetical protein
MFIALLHGLNLLPNIKSHRNLIIPVLLYPPFINFPFIIVCYRRFLIRIDASNAFPTEFRNEDRLLEKLGSCITQCLSHSVLAHGKYLCSPFGLEA